MRDILFRGKRIDNGEWVEGYYVRLNDVSVIITEHYVEYFDRISGKTSNSGQYVVDPSTISKFTGLTDKNGKKIFEGDIVSDNAVWHEEKIQIKRHVNIVGFNKGCWIIYHNKWWDFLYTNASDLEVIGNIHDNFELLEEQT